MSREDDVKRARCVLAEGRVLDSGTYIIGTNALADLIAAVRRETIEASAQICERESDSIGDGRDAARFIRRGGS
jgi:hypothetical protein